MNEREKLQKTYTAARSNLLLMTVLTACNVVAMAARFGLRNLFSAAIPQIAYAYFAGSGRGQEAAGLGWIILRADTSSVLDAVFHIWVIISLVSGVKAAAKLAALPVQANACAQDIKPAETAETEAVNGLPSCPLGPYDGRGRRVFSETYKGMQIEVYRREPRTILVVDGQVYSEWTGLVELRYALSARVNGVPIVCSAVAEGFSGWMRLYADGQLLAQKRRII